MPSADLAICPRVFHSPCKRRRQAPPSARACATAKAALYCENEQNRKSSTSTCCRRCRGGVRGLSRTAYTDRLARVTWSACRCCGGPAPRRAAAGRGVRAGRRSRRRRPERPSCACEGERRVSRRAAARGACRGGARTRVRCALTRRSRRRRPRGLGGSQVHAAAEEVRRRSGRSSVQKPPEHSFQARVCTAGLGWAAGWPRWLGLDEAQLAR